MQTSTFTGIDLGKKNILWETLMFDYNSMFFTIMEGEDNEKSNCAEEIQLAHSNYTEFRTLCWQKVGIK